MNNTSYSIWLRPIFQEDEGHYRYMCSRESKEDAKQWIKDKCQYENCNVPGDFEIRKEETTAVQDRENAAALVEQLKKVQEEMNELVTRCNKLLWRIK